MNPMDANTNPRWDARPGVTVLGSAWRYRWLMIGLMASFAAIALIVSQLLPPLYVGRTSLLLDESTLDVLDSGQVRSQDRLVQNQLEVFKSAIVAERAVRLAGQAGYDVPFRRLVRDTDITSVRGTDVISVSYTAEEEGEAEVVAAAVLQAYQEVRREQRRTETETILERLDAASQLLETDLGQVRRDIDGILQRRSLSDQTGVVLDELAAIEAELAVTDDIESREDLMVRRNELDGRLRTLQLASEIEAGGEDLSGFIRRRDEILNQLATIASRVSDVELELQAQGSGVAFVDPATVTPTREGASSLFILGAGAFLGLLIGLGAAYSLATRRATFSARREPEAVLGISLLADIPQFRSEDGELPVIEDPRSPIAEAFRFAASNLEVALRRNQAKVAAFISADAGDGKSTLLANTALAAARSGRKVLVIDADFGNQGVTELLLKNIPLSAGLTELVAGQVVLADATTAVAVAGHGEIEVLSRGALPSVAPDFFSQQRTIVVFDKVSSLYDLVLIDCPPILQVAYAANVAQLAGHTVLVVGHDSSISKASELVERTRFIGVRTVGYLYNRAPIRPELLESGGSMKDVLGDRGVVAPIKPR